MYRWCCLCTSGEVYVPLVKSLQDVPLVEFMYCWWSYYRMCLWGSLCTAAGIMRGCISGGVYVPLVGSIRGCSSGGVYVPLTELSEDIHLVGEMYLVFTRMPGESYRGRLRSLFAVFVFWALINSIECWLCTDALGLVLFHTQRSHTRISVCNCFQDMLSDKQLCPDLYPSVMKFGQSVSQSSSKHLE